MNGLMNCMKSRFFDGIIVTYCNQRIQKIEIHGFLEPVPSRSPALRRRSKPGPPAAHGPGICRSPRWPRGLHYREGFTQSKSIKSINHDQTGLKDQFDHTKPLVKHLSNTRVKPLQVDLPVLRMGAVASPEEPESCILVLEVPDEKSGELGRFHGKIMGNRGKIVGRW